LSLFKELKRRNVFKVTIAYIVMAWLVMQVADVVLNNIVAPSWVFHVLLLFLAVGLLLAVFFAWAFELTPEGLKREHEVDRTQSITPETGKYLNTIIFVVMALALGYFVYDKLVLSAERDSALVEATTRAVSEKTASEDASSESDKSIAVLPFVNMSSDEGQEYFSDGLSEELLNLLVRIPELQVAARTSSFFYKGKLGTVTLVEIAQQLNVAYFLEGSVRKSGDEVRITAQLIKADDGYHLWSETYDRQLDDIFAIQDEIAAAVVAQLKITLLGAAPLVRETDPQAYALYLQGRHLAQQRTPAGYEQAQELLKQALAIDPDYPAAWSELGYVYMNQVNIGLRPINEGYALAHEANNKALAIDPDYAPAHSSLGIIVLENENDLTAAARHIEHALQLEPANLHNIRRATILAASLGRLDEALALAEFIVSRDPVNPNGHFFLGSYYSYAGRWDEAIASFRTTLTLSPGYSSAQYNIGVVLLMKGEPQAALEAMQLEDSAWGRVGLPMAYYALGMKNESDAALVTLIEKDEQSFAYNIAYVLAYRGEADRAFEWLDKAVVYKDPGLADTAIESLFSNIHDDSRWLPFLGSIDLSPEQLADIEFNVTLPK